MTAMRFLAIARSGDRAGRGDIDALAAPLQLVATATPAWWLLGDPNARPFSISGTTVALGTVFDRATQRPFRPEPRHVSDPVLPQAEAQFLVRHCWGHYLAFGGRSDGDRFCMRDPSGGLPAFYTVHDGRLLIASGLDLLHGGGATRADIDWTELAHHFLFSQPPAVRTCIADVRELTAGAVLVDAPGGVGETQIWKPSNFADAASEVAMADAARHLRETVESTVGAWTGLWRQPLIEMSGGLDSSIVAAAAAAARGTSAGVTLVTPGPDGDEREMATRVSRHLGMSLFECRRDVDRIDVGRAIAPQFPRPGVRGFTQESDRLISAVADDVGADVLFNGGGGDSLFCKLDTADFLLDRVMRGARPSAILRTACDTADTMNVTIWTVLREAYRTWRAPWGDSPTPGRARLMPGRPAIAPASSHPLLTGLSSLPPGRRRHATDLVAIGGHRFGMARARARPMIFPLLSQPIQEACLGYPSWMWVHDGHDRAIARHAFAPLLPEEIAFRRSKGRLDVFGHQLFVTHRAAIRDMLLGGALAAEGLIDRAEVERRLADHGPARNGGYFLLLELADIEAWVQGVRARAWARS